jgi:hypothetical protein
MPIADLARAAVVAEPAFRRSKVIVTPRIKGRRYGLGLSQHGHTRRAMRPCMRPAPRPNSQTPTIEPWQVLIE